ncbi:DUF1156 domain-containing protein [Paenibacillus sp. tmac-D7]|uniref:DUF1156 domain-containing protein n=1 Tax=Paenibacillus sp. tmac-D7 TaxID=2591462 RepID=UPI00114446A7|nr:DUF1156 domain-containing protein [Paenibacillus sp. tmac-D7]
MANIKTPKKLIEVALPLDDINEESVREKSIRQGHPSTLHLWWARRPLAAARAVLFAQMVNDPGYERQLGRGINKESAQKERERLFGIMRKLVKWENVNNEEVLNEAREEIWKSWRETCELNKGIPGFDPDKLPAFHDPFAGGGAIPLEAQRLGLESYASDLNPVAVMINKAMIEIPPKFAGSPPVNPEQNNGLIQVDDDWIGAKGLAEDVRYYGQWMREEAHKIIGHLYPEVDLQPEHGGGKSTVIAWIWARTVKSPNPAFSHVDVPLVSTFYLSTKKGKEVYIEPVVEGDSYKFEVRYGKPQNEERVKNGTKLARGANFQCLLSDTPITPNYIKNEGLAGRIGTRLMAIVAKGSRGRYYLSPTTSMETVAFSVKSDWRPDVEIPGDKRSMFTPLYGLTHFSHLFTERQLFALTVFSDLVLKVREKVIFDAIQVDKNRKNDRFDANSYADAIAVYLALAVDRLAMSGNSLVRWNPVGEKAQHAFGRQALPMLWDFAEPNFLAGATGSLSAAVKLIYDTLIWFTKDVQQGGSVQLNATNQNLSDTKIVSTDPPYYDNIGYADLSDFFYVWLRRSLKPLFPDLFGTLAVPKNEELVAIPYRHSSKEQAEMFFLEGMTRAMHNLAVQAHPAFPVTIYYAFKQSDTLDSGIVSSGWETFLEAVIRAGFALTGTWPMRTEMKTRQVAMGTNALASSIILVCRRRSSEAETVSRRLFVRELNETLPEALETMIGGNRESSPIAAVDLQQASIGPGMSVFSKYKAVLEADGSQMTVRTALQLINRVVDAYLNASDGELDADTLFCLNWLDQFGWNPGDYGQAEVLATAKGTTVEGMKAAGVLESGQGKVRLIKWKEYPTTWNPEQDNRTPVWEALHHMIRSLQQRGEQDAGRVLAGMPARSDSIRNLAYRLYTLFERKGWADDARPYNELIASWDAIDAAAHDIGHHGTQIELF